RYLWWRGSKERVKGRGQKEGNKEGCPRGQDEKVCQEEEITDGVQPGHRIWRRPGDSSGFPLQKSPTVKGAANVRSPHCRRTVAAISSFATPFQEIVFQHPSEK